MNKTILGSGLSIRLDPGSGVPLYRQLIQQIELAILAGRLGPGDRLPTIRALAIDQRINPNTIAKAYNELEIRGIVLTQVGNGTFVADRTPEPADAAREKKKQELTARYIQEMAGLGASLEEIIGAVTEYKEI